ncbi:MAG: hypothetical protein BAJALOKI3v1_240049 [Promethearchaeota archaeon]|nr:MAG: hypothetical protein BAJALOKI3v1_240049 [Candidatus Lokiarchaeota archaeon]
MAYHERYSRAPRWREYSKRSRNRPSLCGIGRPELNIIINLQLFTLIFFILIKKTYVFNREKASLIEFNSMNYQIS